MNQPAADPRSRVDDVVQALAGASRDGADETAQLERRMQLAAADIDDRAAEGFARALLEALCQEPADPRRLEALLVLGLAHPTVLERHRISLPVEAERLAAMLHAHGEAERARALLEVVAAAESSRAAQALSEVQAEEAAPLLPDEVEEQIEHLIAKADGAAARGSTQRAIRLLQEVVALDRNRRDVARMIRDLRWQEQERRSTAIRRLKAAGVFLLVAACVGLVVLRELRVQERYRAIPPAIAQDAESLRARLAAVEGLLDDQHAWFGMGDALRDRSRLTRELAEVQERAARAEREAALESERQLALAESTRSRGMLLVQEGRFEEALVDLRRALILGGQSWKHRREVEANVAAIADWIEKTAEREVPNR